MHCFRFLLLGFISQTLAHIELSYPPPLRSKYNSLSNQNTIDYSMTSPLNADGSNFPCKGYQSDLSLPSGGSVATWTAGSTYNLTVGPGGALHGGGSCQVSLSYDKGVSFKVIHSYIGSCPLAFSESFNFQIPSDAAAGDALFAWTWYNMIGNRELYMNCASVTIAGASSKRDAPPVAYADRPDMFVANMANGCTTVETKEVVFPDPGPSVDVSTNQTVADDSGSFTGTCAAVKGIGGGGGGSGSASGSAAVSSAVATASVSVSASASASASAPTSSAPTTLQTVTTSASASGFPISSGEATSLTIVVVSPTTSAAASSSSHKSSAIASATSTSTPSGSSSSGNSTLTTTSDGQCGGPHTCQGSIHGPCCSQWGWCGSTTDYCGAGCQAGFGTCGAGASGGGNSTTSLRMLRKYRR